jgi:hypothetical protein
VAREEATAAVAAAADNVRREAEAHQRLMPCAACRSTVSFDAFAALHGDWVAGRLRTPPTAATTTALEDAYVRDYVDRFRRDYEVVQERQLACGGRIGEDAAVSV